MRSSQKTLEQRVKKLTNSVYPLPLLLDCSSAKEELLLMLSQGEEEGQEDSTPANEDQTERELDAILEQSVRAIEQRYNVQFVSYGK